MTRNPAGNDFSGEETQKKKGTKKRGITRMACITKSTTKGKIDVEFVLLTKFQKGLKKIRIREKER